MVRPGIASYGYPGVNTDLSLDPVMEVTSQIALVKEFPKDHAIGYGRTYSTTRDNERIGIIPIGYGDGFSRALSNKAEVIIGGKRQPLRGRISMDQCAVGIDDDDKVGDEVVLLENEEQFRYMQMTWQKSALFLMKYYVRWAMQRD
jgi:alanine racemase